MDSSGSEKFGFERVMKDSVDASGKLNWESVFRSICEKERSPVPHRPEEVEEIREVLLDTLLTSGCDDERFVLRFFQFYERYLERMFTNFSYQGRAGFIDGTFWRRRGNISREDATYILSPITSCLFSETEHVYSTPGMREAEWRAMNVGDFKYLEALVKYGHWKGVMDSEDYMQREDFGEFITWIHPCPALQFLQNDIEKLWNAVEDPKNVMMSCRGLRRTLLIVRTFKAALLRRFNSPITEQYVHCLRVYFATIPDPMVTYDEVQHFVFDMIFSEPYDRSHCPDEERANLQSYFVSCWTTLFGREPFTPRSLVHLCRLSVRSALVRHKSDKSFVLPDLVGRLSLPRALEDFLLGALEEGQWAETVLKRLEESMHQQPTSVEETEKFDNINFGEFRIMFPEGLPGLEFADAM